MTWIILGAVGVGVFLLFRKQNKETADRDTLMDLAWPTIDHDRGGDTFRRDVSADLQRMLLVIKSSDIDFEEVRVFDLRRGDGPRWEMREHHESHVLRRQSIEHSIAETPAVRSMFEEELADPSPLDWKPISEWQKLETAYQRYLTVAAKAATLSRPPPTPSYRHRSHGSPPAA